MPTATPDDRQGGATIGSDGSISSGGSSGSDDDSVGGGTGLTDSTQDTGAQGGSSSLGGTASNNGSDDDDHDDHDLTDPENYSSDLADSAEEAAGSAEDYGDFDGGSPSLPGGDGSTSSGSGPSGSGPSGSGSGGSSVLEPTPEPTDRYAEYDGVEYTSTFEDRDPSDWLSDDIGLLEEPNSDNDQNQTENTNMSENSDTDLTDPDNYESDLADGAEEAAGSAEDYGDFDAGGMPGVDSEVTYTIDQYGEAYRDTNEDGEEVIRAPEGFELDGEEEQALLENLQAAAETPAQPEVPEMPGLEGSDIETLLAEQRAAFENRIASILQSAGVPDQAGASDSGGGLTPIVVGLGGIGVIAAYFLLREGE